METHEIPGAAAPDDDRPITSWGAAARVLNLDADTLYKKRRKYGDRTREAWWRNADAVFDWYERLIAPPEPHPSARRVRAAHAELGAAVDPRAVARELAGGLK